MQTRMSMVSPRLRAAVVSVGLALMVTFSIVIVLTMISLSAIQPVQASIQNSVTFGSSGVEIAKLSEPFYSPLQVTSAVTGEQPFSVSVSPRKPGRAASLNMKLFVDADLHNGVDEIIFLFDEAWNLPSTLDRNQISVSTDSVTGPGTPHQAVAPQEVTVDFIGVKNYPQVSLRVPDMDIDENTGANGIAARANVTVVFRQGAGIETPAKGASNDYDIGVRVTANGVDPGVPSSPSGLPNVSSGPIFIPSLLEMDSNDAKRGGDLTLAALGVEGNESVTFWRDADLDGIRDAVEIDLCSVVAAGSDTAFCTFTVANPPFVPGLERLAHSTANVNQVGGFPTAGTTLTVSNGSTFISGQLIKIENEYLRITAVAGNNLTVVRGVASNAASHANGTGIFFADVNFINFVDSKGRTTTGAEATPLDDEALARQNLLLEPTVEFSPLSANIGDQVVVSLFDFPPGVLTRITIGGIAVKAADLPSVTVPASGEVDITFTIPSLLEGDIRTPTGRVPVRVFAGGANQEEFITIGGARITLSHSTIVANQDLTIAGSGFSVGSDNCISEGDITINNVAVEIHDADDCPLPGADGILLSSGGTFNLTVRVHDRDIGPSTPISTALFQEGIASLRVIDTQGVEGTTQVQIARRTLVVSPSSARPRDVVSVFGQNFIASNPDGVLTSVGVEYQCGTVRQATTADPDASGNFRESLRIPSGCAIPSTNIITATINANGNTGVAETVTHEIPGAHVRIAPVGGLPGSLVTVSGEDFRAFETVQTIEIGGVDTLGARTVNTDVNGDFRVEHLVVPGLEPGIKIVRVQVGASTDGTVATTSFEVTTPPPEGFDVIAGQLAPLGNKLVRMWNFSLFTKVWLVYDPEALDLSDLTEAVSGRPYWIKISDDIAIEINGVPFHLTCINPGTPQEDCWNLIVWP